MVRVIPTSSTSRLGVGLALATLLVSQPAVRAVQTQAATPDCKPAGNLVSLKGLAEASGLAASSRGAGHLYSHNDSGASELFVLDAKGTLVRKITVPGVAIRDWEAVAVGSCPAGSCIYIADIGDNAGRRDRITIHRLREPDATGAIPTSGETFHATYPDGGHDAETLLVAPDGRLFVVTKSETATLYAFPHELQTGAPMKLTKVGQAGQKNPARITDGAISPKGEWAVLRSNDSLFFYRAADLLSGNWREARRINLKPLGEPQGEGVAFVGDDVLYLAGEGGGKSNAGTFVRLNCR